MQQMGNPGITSDLRLKAWKHRPASMIDGVAERWTMIGDGNARWFNQLIDLGWYCLSFYWVVIITADTLPNSTLQTTLSGTALICGQLPLVSKSQLWSHASFIGLVIWPCITELVSHKTTAKTNPRKIASGWHFIFSSRHYLFWFWVK